MSMTIRLSRDDAYELAFRRDTWLWLKIPIWLILGWFFFLPQLWKILVLFVTLVVAYFRIVGPAGPNVTWIHMTVTVFTMCAVWFVVLWYVIYVMAYLSHPGFLNRFMGVVGIVLFPVALIVLALAATAIGSLFRVPHDELFAYLDRWIPFATWKVIQ